MADWDRIAAAMAKLKIGFSKLTPPEPDDEFENMKRDTMQQVDKLAEYTRGKVIDE